jgi:EAL domain-containing protein (putative c-di-GMP-specific phosphodiesterase class I)
MTEGLDRGTTNAAYADAGAAEATTPLCFVVDEEPSICHFLSLLMQGSGIDTEEFNDYRVFRQALTRRTPDIVFVNIPLESGEAISSIVALGKRGFRGAVQLMSNRGAAVLEHVRNIGEQHSLKMLPVLKKPVEANSIIAILRELKLGLPPSVAARIDLVDALNNNWIEFWYQPKIDLRRKQLVGAEAFARARHPSHGILTPSAFMPGADNETLVILAEHALHNVLASGQTFSKLGLNLRLAVNIPVDALVNLQIPEIVRQYRSPGENWPGLIIDVTEEQIVTDLALANDITKQLSQFNIKLAIDDFGRGYSSLVRLKELPFAELKLDRTFVTDCGTDKLNAPLCKTVIDLAHNFGSIAVAIGIEKASDVVALVSMGCDYGQGFLLGQPMPEERFLSLLRQRSQGRLSASSTPSPDRQQAAAARKTDLQPLDQL